jgi:type I restriction enzyme S subunit
MNKPWSMVKLGEVINHRKEFVRIDDFKTYKRCRVQLHAKGIVIRDHITGSELKTKEQQICRSGDFLVAEIDAKVGGYGIVPDELDGAIVSSHYFLFEANPNRLDCNFLGYFIKTPDFFDQVSARGTTNYAAIRPSHVLQYHIPLPPMEEQRRIVAKMDELVGKIEEAKSIRSRTASESEKLLASVLHRYFSSSEVTVGMRRPIAAFSTILRGRGPIYFEGSGKLAINQKCVRWSGIDITFTKEVSDIWIRSLPVQNLLKEYDVVVNSTGEGTIGRACVVTANAVGLPFDSHILVVRVQEDKALPKFIAYFLQSPDGQSAIEDSKGAKTTKQTELGTTKLGNIIMPLPSIPEQQRIISNLDELQGKVDGLRQYQVQTSAELEAFLPSILDKAFKGEL